MFALLVEVLFNVREGEMTSLKSKLRGNLLKSHGQRKNSRNHIWLTYSFKKRGDITLASNNECIYWASRLEAGHEVKDFTFGTEVIIKYPWEETARKREVILVEGPSGMIEFHKLVSGAKVTEKEMVTLFENGSLAGEVPLTFVDAKDLASMAISSVQWQKVLSFAAQIRDEMCSAEANWLNLFFRTNGAGDVNQVLINSGVYDPMKILGVFARAALKSEIELDFSSIAFGKSTKWILRGD
jgi:hypothetical protein